MKHAITIAILLFFNTLQAETVRYLEQKTVFCFSQDSLEKYLNMAEQRNLQGLNQLILNDECDFVEEGNIIALYDFDRHTIGDMPVISFENQNKTLWTFQAFIKQYSPKESESVTLLDHQQ